MTKFTALDDPDLEQTVEAHLQRIVTAVTSHMKPTAIMLRGSFGRGEGSVVVSDGRTYFLSDYEIDVATLSPFYRSLFRDLSCQMTRELGVETSLRWVRPDYMSRDRVGPLPMGAAPITISLYESRYGSRILYGQNLIDAGPAVDPRDIRMDSAAFLMLNRMAESLSYMSRVESQVVDPWEGYYWVNKTLLACAESLLLLWGDYHFSYAERGRRFAAKARGTLEFMGEDQTTLAGLVARATEFKLRPRLSLYPESLDETWRRVVPICDKVFRHVTSQAFDLGFVHYTELPGRFLQRAASDYRALPLHRRGALKLLSLYKCLRVGHLSRALLSPYGISLAVYGIVPLMFVSWAAEGDTLADLLTEIRRRLTPVCRKEAPASDPSIEWDTLRQQVLWAWKNFCYL
jgi:hypothetical protein